MADQPPLPPLDEDDRPSNPYGLSEEALKLGSDAQWDRPLHEVRACPQCSADLTAWAQQLLVEGARRHAAAQQDEDPPPGVSTQPTTLDEVVAYDEEGW